MSWAKRYLNSISKWTNFPEYMDFYNVFKYSPEYIERTRETTTDCVGLDVMNSLQLLQSSSCFKVWEVILTAPLWFNIIFQLQLNRQWHDKGIVVIGYLLDVFYNILPLETINETININLNFLEHHSLKSKFKEFCIIAGQA